MGVDHLTEIDERNERAYLMRGSNPTQAKIDAEELVIESRKLKYDKGVGRALRTLAAVEVLSNPVEAYMLATRAVSILEKAGDTSGVASTLMTVYCYYHHIGWYEDGLLVLQDAYEKARLANNVYVAVIALYNMGVNLEERGDVHEAKRYYALAKQEAETSPDHPIYWNAVNAFAKLSAVSDDDPCWVKDIEQAQAEFLKGGNLSAGCESYTALAEIYSNRGEFATALRNLRAARALVRKHHLAVERITLYLELGEYLLKRKQFGFAKLYFQHALESARSSKYTMTECRALERLAFAQQKTGEFEAAVSNLYEHLAVKERLFNETSENRLRDLQTFHKLELVQSEATLAKKKYQEVSAINFELANALEQQSRLQKELMRLASTDDLTGAVNRRQIVNDGTLEVERFRHVGAPFVTCILDVDHFKGVNDSFGHAAGDEVLRRLAAECQKHLRKFDVFGRLGGEEFCVIYHDTDLSGAMKSAQRLLQSVREIDVSDVLGDKTLTVSMGLCQVNKHHDSFYDVLRDADMALYEAKNSGRDQLRVSSTLLENAA
ncbi:MAG TPA: GGDEF domain-containing protein [Fimbriimonas sp.]|nr:GGDEF domain-containing protein [Fimbriimonas sp.]